ncbi:hypothetical protein YC2023_013029 [Brassica napus]
MNHLDRKPSFDIAAAQKKKEMTQKNQKRRVLIILVYTLKMGFMKINETQRVVLVDTCRLLMKRFSDLALTWQPHRRENSSLYIKISDWSVKITTAGLHESSDPLGTCILHIFPDIPETLEGYIPDYTSLGPSFHHSFPNHQPFPVTKLCQLENIQTPAYKTKNYHVHEFCWSEMFSRFTNLEVFNSISIRQQYIDPPKISNSSSYK